MKTTEAALAMMRTFTSELAGMDYQAYASNPGSVRMGRQIDDRCFVEVQIRADGDHRAADFIATPQALRRRTFVLLQK